MSKARMEAFSDGVIAIIITIMVLELREPESGEFSALLPLLPILGAYLASFIFIGIYWNNHHHLFHVVQHVDGRVLWANLHLLFWLSLVPFATAWMSGTNFAPLPVAAYGFVLLFCAISFTILVMVLVAVQGPQSKIAEAIGSDFKGKASLVLYLIAIPIALFINPLISMAIYVTVSLIWFVPDQRFERVATE